jgi:hypothetical protein
MSRTLQEKLLVNRMLGQNGLGQLDDPGLVKQLGFAFAQVIRTHEALRELINKCEPRERYNMLEVLRPYLCFKPKALDIYIAEMAALADARRMPTQDADGNLQPHRSAEIGTAAPAPTPVETYYEAQRALIAHDLHKPGARKTDIEVANAAVAEATAKAHLWLVCGQCTREGEYHGWDKTAALSAARMDGWTLAAATEKEHCPKCAAK